MQCLSILSLDDISSKISCSASNSLFTLFSVASVSTSTLLKYFNGNKLYSFSRTCSLVAKILNPSFSTLSWYVETISSTCSSNRTFLLRCLSNLSSARHNAVVFPVAVSANSPY